MSENQDNTFERFDPVTVPLDGLRLIEASAGTGKTFSLAGLYLRLLVEKQLSVREILVMTFTRAATQELRERIRARLNQAARLAADPGVAEDRNPEHGFALQVIDQAVAHRDRDAVIRQLREAAERMDEATISTIHGFAQQAAAENAFDSGLPFDRGEQIDDGRLHREAAADYWREQVVGQPGSKASAFLQLWPDPDALDKALGPLLNKPHLELAGPDNSRIEKKASQIRELWAEQGEQLKQQLHEAEENNRLYAQCALTDAVQRAGSMEAVIESLEAGINGTSSGYPALPEWIANFETQIQKRAIKQGFKPHELPVAEALAELQPLGRLAALREALSVVRERALERKRERRQFSFADMVTGLHEAITDKDSGETLAASLHRTWPWALVDEFQDTDPLQYGILKRIYQGRETGGLLMIGDPKQAIYGFRGGDVFAYLQASKDAEARYHLDTNFRSTPSMLDAVASLFHTGGNRAFVIDRIRFQDVKPGREAGDRVIRRNGDELAPMTLWRADLDQNKAGIEKRLREATVNEIYSQLDGNTVIEEKEESTNLKPADIAVLVNTNQQATEMQQALSRRGIAAVCLHQQSVFASDEATEVLRLLRAAAAPADEDAVRAALATTLLGHRMGDLIDLGSSETAWREVVARFQSAHERWRHQGVLAMLEPLLQQESERLLGYEDGERRMTNYLQLAELAQQASGEHFGFAGLIRWLETSIEDPSSASQNDAEQLRLESDDALVRIATVHKVKGLQYRVVFLPFAPFLGTMGSPDKPPFVYHDERDRALLDVGVMPEAQAAAVREQRAEAVRLLYVALTRAEQACFLPWGAMKDAQNSALGWLLHQADGADAEVRQTKKDEYGWFTADVAMRRLREVAERADGTVRLAELPEPLPGGTRAPAESPPTGKARDDRPAPRTPWSVFSFSRLVRGASHAAVDTGAEDEAPDERLAEAVSADIPLRGPDFGTAVHDMLENADFGAWPAPDTAPGEAERDHVAKYLRRWGLVVPDGREGNRLLDQIAGLVGRTLYTNIDGVGRLADLPAHERLAEMEFFVGLGGSRTAGLITTLAEHGYDVALPESRREQILNGLMHGFIDLTVAAGGRYYVIDYKTNDLGPEQRHYRPDALAEAVRAAHYDLQYLIYTVALHRHLKQRLPDYDPDTHLGGVRYLFLRGMTGGEEADGVFADRPPVALIEKLDALFAGGEVAA